MSSPIDRLTHTARTISATAALTAPIGAGPYSRAVLTTQLGDLIRDIDASELCLFASTPQLTRAQFSPATPLRKPPPRRDDASKPADVDPETYAQAAIKCIGRYQVIRPMPRAHSQALEILERLQVVRQSMRNLNETLHQAQSIPGSSIRTLVENEEKGIQALQSRIAELNRRKRDATSKHRIRDDDTSQKPQAQATSPPSSPHEDKFWNTPATTARSLRFTDNLMDEQVDLGNISTTSFMSPLPSSPFSRSPPTGQAVNSSEPLLFYKDRSGRIRRGQMENDDRVDSNENSIEEANDTVVHGPNPTIFETVNSKTPSSTPESIQRNTASAIPGTRHPRLQVNTEVEGFVAKIWATMGDVIMPGHPYDLFGRGVGNKPPRAKETISHLHSLAALSPSPASPSGSSVSSSSSATLLTPTAQQILTAHLLLCLLSSPPHFSMPLNEAKGLLIAKANVGGSTAVGQGTTRILYGCVAKRLIKIERGKGEQIVKFDV